MLLRSVPSPGRLRRRAVGLSLLLLPLLLSAFAVVPFASAAPTTSGGVPSVAQNSCPNVYYYGSGTQMDLQQTVDCAGAAGFSGNLEITFVSMAYQESTFCPGAIESGSGTCMSTSPGCGSGLPDAEGILQEGTAGQCPPAGGSFAVSGYSPSSCSTWSGSSSDWGGIYFNPLCSFQWALAYYNYNTYNFWGSYLSGAYCKWAPVGFAGTGSMLCDSANGYPTGGENQAGLPWSTVCPGNVCGNSSSTPLSVSYAMSDTTTSTSLLCGGTFAAGNTIQFSATPTGGTSPYTYAWAFGDGSTGTGQTPTHVYLSAGTVNPTVTITDSKGLTNSSGAGCSFTVTAPPALAISSFIASPAALQLGNATTFQASVTGGVTPYTYAYTSLPAGCTSSNSASFSCTPTAAGNFTVQVTVTDPSSQSTSATTTLAITASALIISQFTVSPSTIPLGGTTYLNVTATGGTTPYSYAYTGLPSGCTTSSTASLACTPTASGNFSVQVNVTDAGGTTVTSSRALLTVAAPGLVITAFTASPQNFTLGNSTTLTVSATGGVAPYSYAYIGLPAGCATANQNTLLCTPTATGPFTVTVSVTDSSGKITTGSVVFTVSPVTPSSPTISAFTIAPSTVSVNGTVYLNVTASGGVAPLVYSYQGLPLGCSSANQASLSCAPTAAGTFTITAVVTDAAGHQATRGASLTVTSPAGYPSIQTFTATPASLTLGGTTVLRVTASGGQTPYSIRYSGLPTGCSSANTSSLNCTPSAAGNFTVQVQLTDALGHSVFASTNVAVTVAVSPLKIVGYAASRNPDLVGEGTYLNVTTNGGDTPLTYSYSGLPQGCTSADTASLLCTPGVAGNFTVTVAVSDPAGQQVFATYSLVVKAAVPPSSGPSSGPSTTALADWALISGVVIVGAVALVVIARKHRRDRQFQGSFPPQ